jgi:hypothetical protein
MTDITYRLPDGSIKSFPDTISTQDIRRFVAKSFPGRSSKMWLSKPISTHAEQEPSVEDEPHLTSRFDDDTLATMAQLFMRPTRRTWLVRKVGCGVFRPRHWGWTRLRSPRSSG